MNDSRKDLLLWFIGLVVFLGVLFIAVYSGTAHAEEDSSAIFQVTESSESSEVDSATSDGENGGSVNVNVIQETVVDANNAPATLKANAIGYTPIADVTAGNTYASILYDVFLNQGNTFDDFIIFQSGDYRYFLIYGTIKKDLSFSSCNVVRLDYSNSWQSGKRYTLTYSEGVSGSFRSNGYTYLSNLKGQNAFSPDVTFERKEMYKTRIAVYVLAVMTLFSSFRFFRKSTVGRS